MEQMQLSTSHSFLQKTNKFKTIVLEWKFRSTYEPAKASMRTLIKNILVTNTKKYPTQKDVEQQLSWLYGASLSSSSQRFGTQHILSFRLKIVNDRYLKQADSLLDEAFQFMEELLFEPNTQEGSFHEKTFIREQKNLLNEFDSLIENKSAYASKRMNDLLFVGTEQAYLGIGDPAGIRSVSAKELFEVYQEMIQQDDVRFYVSGDVEPERIEAILETSRTASLQQTGSDAALLYHRPVKAEVLAEDEQQEVTQGKLYLGFSAPAPYLSKDYYTALLWNGIFGGFPHSKLFQNVREKESLAYSTSSSIDFFRGVLLVQAGIAFDKREQSEAIILEQVEAMRRGEFEDAILQQTKDMVLNQFRLTADNQVSLVSKDYLERLAVKEQGIVPDFEEMIHAVTKEQIAAYTNQIQLQAVYFLKGEDDVHEEN